MSRPRLLVLRPGALGDVCMALPLVTALARRADVSWLLRPAYVPLLRSLSSANIAALPFPHRLGSGHTAPDARLIGALRELRFDALLDLCHWPETAALVRHLGDVPLRGIGLDPGQDRRLGIPLAPADLYAPFNARVPVGHLRHQADKWRQLVAATLGPVDDDWPLPPAPASTSGRLRVFVQPHAGRPEKVWPTRRFAETLAWLARQQAIEVVVNGGNRPEWPRALQLWARLSWGGVRARILRKDRGYRRLIETLRCCDLALGNDSGPMHLAALLGVPTVVLFGPFAAAEFGPRWRCQAVSAPAGQPMAALPVKGVLEGLAASSRIASIFR